ncbi:hypothetical protein CSC17_5144 [Klebsiella oxytoca]|nr:hypothetical protein CSC17_5144 [Klebsiella oxytoca]
MFHKSVAYAKKLHIWRYYFMIMKIVIIGDVHEKRFVEEMFHARS